MKYTTTCLAFFTTVFSATAQPDIEKYVKKNHIEITSISNDTSYAGYEAIAKAIGDKRVVMLGEQDHGDAPSFLAKTKIIKYLHEKKGFNVLAFESDFFSLTKGQEEIMNDTVQFRKYLQGNIFPIWPFCDACSDLFYQYLPAAFLSSSPITVTGFDNQLHGWYTRRKIHGYLDSVISMLKSEIPQYDATRTQVLAWTDSIVKNYGKKFGKKEEFENYEHLMKQVLDAWLGKKGDDYTARLLQSMTGFSNQSFYFYGRNWWEGGEIRDREMAANLDWLVNVKYKNEKIIVWAADGHIAKNSGKISGLVQFTMGTFFCNMPGNETQTYILGFTSSQGRAGRINMKQYDVPPPRRKSFETWFGSKPFAFIDFLSSIASLRNESFLMKPMGHHYNNKQPWTNCFDGIFYIRDMYPCKKTF